MHHLTTSSGTTTYEYDELHRLTKEVVTGDPEGEDMTIDYAYDKVGNRQSQKVTNSSGTVETTYFYDENDRLTHEHIDGLPSRTYTYDDNGNLDAVDIIDQPGTVDIDYTWDAENRLTAVAIHDGQGGVQNIAYEYDAQGVRVSKTVDGVETKYLIDQMRPYAQVLEEYTGEGGTRQVQTSYTYGNDLIGQEQGNTNYFYLEDIHSGVRQMTDDMGNVTDTYEYDAYGNLLAGTGSTTNNYLYRGEQMDGDVDLQYLRARYYDPATGRFVSTDPFEGYQELPVSRHRYLYGNANPVIFADPSGLITSLAELSVLQKMSLILATSGFSLGIAQGRTALMAEKYGGDRVTWEGQFLNSGLGSASRRGASGLELLDIGLATTGFLVQSSTMQGNDGGFYKYEDLVVFALHANLGLGFSRTFEDFWPGWLNTTLKRLPDVWSGFSVETEKDLAEQVGVGSISGAYLSVGVSIRAVGGAGLQNLIMGFSRGNAHGLHLGHGARFAADFDSGIVVPVWNFKPVPVNPIPQD